MSSPANSSHPLAHLLVFFLSPAKASSKMKLLNRWNLGRGKNCEGMEIRTLPQWLGEAGHSFPTMPADEIWRQFVTRHKTPQEIGQEAMDRKQCAEVPPEYEEHIAQ